MRVALSYGSNCNNIWGLYTIGMWSIPTKAGIPLVAPWSCSVFSATMRKNEWGELIRWSILQAFVERDAAIRWRIEDKWSQALKHVSWGLRCISRFYGSQRNMIRWLRSDYNILGLAWDWIGRQTRSVLANPILWYKAYLGGLGSTLGGTRVLSSWVAVLQRLLARALRASRVVCG